MDTTSSAIEILLEHLIRVTAAGRHDSLLDVTVGSFTAHACTVAERDRMVDAARRLDPNDGDLRYRAWVIVRSQGNDFVAGYENGKTYATATLHVPTCPHLLRKAKAMRGGPVYPAMLADFFDRERLRRSGNQIKVCRTCCNGVPIPDDVPDYKWAQRADAV